MGLKGDQVVKISRLTGFQALVFIARQHSNATMLSQNVRLSVCRSVRLSHTLLRG